MRSRKELYVELLGHGLTAIRGAAETGNLERCKQEACLLHNIPSLLDEPNFERHLYFLYAEKSEYLEWVLKTKDPATMSFVNAYYVPVWNELEDMARKQKAEQQNPGT